MQNKGIIRLFTILLALVCVYQLSFTLVSRNVEKKAEAFGRGNQVKTDHYLDSISGETVYNFLGIRKYSYKDVKQREIQLGLDLKGGMNVTLEISVVDLVKAMSNYSKDPTFNAAINKAVEYQKNSQDDFVTLFGKAYKEIDPNAKLASVFLTPELKEKINFNSSNEDVLKVIRTQADAAIDNSFNILSSRIDRFGVVSPNIQKLTQRGRILVELPGVKDKERVRKLLQGTAALEFWETYENQEMYPYLLEANKVISAIKKSSSRSIAPAATTTNPSADNTATTKSGDESLLDQLESTKTDSTAAAAEKTSEAAGDYPLFSVLIPNANKEGQLFPGPAIGFTHSKDTSLVNSYFNLPQVKSVLPRDLKLAWQQKPFDEKGNFYQLVALKITTRDGRAPLNGDAVTDARQDFGQNKASAEVDMTMNNEGSKTWARMTKDNLGRSIAIVLDGYVVSYPTVQSEITGGRSNITGHFTVEEAKDLANMLKSGAMPAPAKIVEESVVGPTLGKESIHDGFLSFFVAFLLVLGFMMLMYSGQAGSIANVALVCNLFFLLGVLASFGAVLTLPGIAGIVLTMGMAVDANVLIYERIQEEMRAGKGIKLAVKEGFQHALSAIVDGQLTTMIVGIVLYIFGSGPIKGFATTLVIGICTSLFTSIYITHLVADFFLEKDKNIKFITNFAKGILQGTNFKFIGARKYAYWISGILITASILSIAIKGFDYGIDFKGGRTYVVEFKQPVRVADVAGALSGQFGSAPEVKTYGNDNTVRITTDYKIDDNSTTIDSEIEGMLYTGLKSMLGSDVSMDSFNQDYIKSSNKVGPTISDDIKKGAVIAILIALIGIFIYILVRFRNWRFSMGGVVALAHDATLVMGFFSLFSGILPFSLEVDQAFVAAILTVIGYSINDTVIIFDRIREYLHLHPKATMEENMDNAINHTLRRTLNTSSTVLVVLVAILLFGGATIRGFSLAMLIGVVVGTYSSVFVASPLAFDAQRVADNKKKLKK
ncbi:MAG TPA: protein translocase subunit SecDF [Prolixibacteraceae bacterium]|nr:protein translocase subunit SecDF [Prolixibacteraceae bacterium]